MAGGPGLLAAQMQRTLRQILLFAGQRTRLNVSQKLQEAVVAGLEAASVERESAVVVGELEAPPHVHVAGVDGRQHRVPRDAVLALSFEQGPGGRKEAGMTRQRAIVEVEGTTAGLRQQLGRDDLQPRDREDPFDPRELDVVRILKERQPVASREICRSAAPGDDAEDLVPSSQQFFRTT
jgi:hypothetical protein